VGPTFHLPSELWKTIGDGPFFLRHNIWGFAKLQDLGNKKSQTVGVALSVMLQAISIYYIFCSGILAKPTKHWCYVASVGFQLGLANFNSIKIK
jgi:hypothetical protein